MYLRVPFCPPPSPTTTPLSVHVRLRGRSAARKQAIKPLIQNICIGFKGGVSAVLDACLITRRAQRATQWAAETRCNSGSSRWPFAYHSCLSPRRRSNLTCPSVLHPPFRPRLPTQWTVPTSACCQSTHAATRHKNTKQRGWTFASAPTGDKAAFTCMGCVSVALVHLDFHAFVSWGPSRR